MLEPVSVNVSQCLWALLPTCYKTLQACKIKVPFATGCSEMQFHWWLWPETLHIRPFTPPCFFFLSFFLGLRLIDMNMCIHLSISSLIPLTSITCTYTDCSSELHVTPQCLSASSTPGTLHFLCSAAKGWKNLFLWTVSLSSLIILPEIFSRNIVLYYYYRY